MRASSIIELAATVMLGALVSIAGCAVERSDQIDGELRRLNAQANEGVAKIERALHDPELTSSELGEGMLRVDLSARMLRAIEADDRASDMQQVMAILYQARAWDDVARTLESAEAPNLEAGQRATMSRVLGEKALPARAQAGESYRRARERACRSSLAEPVLSGLKAGDGLAPNRTSGVNPDRASVLLEILDGVARYGGGNIPFDKACSEQ
jgi:hypothetical protein